MLSRKLTLLAGFGLWGCLAQTTASAFECYTYEQVTDKLASTYHEQRVFSAFTDDAERPDAHAVYELWVNPEKGNWSLVSQRVFLFQRVGSGVTAKSCALIVSSGKRHHVITQHPVADSADALPPTAAGMDADASELAADAVAGASSPAPASTWDTSLNCIPRERHAQALKERYDEVPVMRALANDDTVLEIYGSGESWTIARSTIREVRNTMTGRPLIDDATGQKIHQLCSDPAYSGKTWALIEPTRSHI